MPSSGKQSQHWLKSPLLKSTLQSPVSIVKSSPELRQAEGSPACTTRFRNSASLLPLLCFNPKAILVPCTGFRGGTTPVRTVTQSPPSAGRYEKSQVGPGRRTMRVLHHRLGSSPLPGLTPPV